MKSRPAVTKAAELLLVEDNPYDLELTLRALQLNNVSSPISVVRDGAEALDFLFSPGKQMKNERVRSLKVIILDLKLPKVDGLEVLRAIKADERTRLIPVVVLTSSSEDRDILHSYLFGASSYIVKHVEFDKFSEAVSEVGRYWLLLNQSPR
jgi:two-component system, response regulator